MNTTNIALLAGMLAALSIAPAAAQQAGGKKLYCWNENGRKVCGDALPASAADAARTEISARSGLKTGQVARALTEAERAAAGQQAEADRLSAVAEEERVRREQAMVESYTTEEELMRAFEHRITLLDETVKASSLGITGLRQSLVSLLRRAGEAELAGKPVPAPLTASIQSQHQQLVRQQAMLVRQREERATMDAELAGALKRYRELKMPATPPAEG
ncbi:hypothetical protein [Aerolutibacter ruishenii]|uniref:DUF4124 domain-containing protein n=1 Tax=Aerolutibacter ruishenii TaxID=686800 RepID=A0A562M143_9GAMM|nr:hypothetical protein [Lysobacter ruishenii]TWI13636.1 hypothetical protein IP93_00799 [Lysobacter ruishenii]